MSRPQRKPSRQQSKQASAKPSRSEAMASPQGRVEIRDGIAWGILELPLNKLKVSSTGKSVTVGSGADYQVGELPDVGQVCLQGSAYVMSKDCTDKAWEEADYDGD